MSKVIFGFAAALFSLIVIGSLFVSSLISKVELSDLAVQAYDVIRDLEGLLSNLSDAESAALEYRLAADRHYLDRYETHRSAIHANLNTLRQKIKNDPDQTRSLSAVEASVHDKLQLLEKLVRLHHDHPESPDHLAQEERLVTLGGIVMDRARNSIESMQDSVDAILTIRLREMERARMKTSRWLLTATMLTIVIVAWLFFAVHRQTSQRIRAQEALLESNSELENRIQDRTRELLLSNDRLTTLSRQVIQVQEQERRRIARDLHDEIGHSLTALKLELREIRDHVEGTAVSTSVGKCIEILDPMLQQVRRVALELRPSLLDELGLQEALKWYVTQFAKRATLTVRFDEDHQSGRFSEQTEIAAFRVVQEALNNVAKHAHATTVNVTMKQLVELLVITVRDDGVGFSPPEAQSSTLKGECVGLSCMEERLRLVGGTLTVISSPGRGTEITATFPIKKIVQVPHTLEGSRT